MIKAESNADHTNTEVTISGSLDEVLNAFRGICKSMKTALESRFGKEDGSKIYAAIVGDLSDEDKKKWLMQLSKLLQGRDSKSARTRPVEMRWKRS